MLLRLPLPLRYASACLAALCLGSVARAKDTNVADYGAVTDGSQLATPALQRAVDDCAASGGGRVTVPPGVYLTRTVHLRSGVDLHLERGAVLLGEPKPGGFESAVVYGREIEHAAVTGFGTINGQGQEKNFPPAGQRHNDLLFYRCKDVTVHDITLRDSASWVFRLRECDGVKIRGVTIYSYANQNNDGIDIEARNVTVSDCRIESEDDSICLKSDNPDFIVENVAITNCVIASNCNAIKFGTSSRGGFRNVSISNCVVRWPSEGAKVPPRSALQGCDVDAIAEAGLALEVVDGGFMEQVTVTNLTMTGIQTPLFIRLGNRKGPGRLKNVLISQIAATDETLLNSSITGIPGSYVENVVLRDVVFTSKGTGTLKEANAAVPEKTSVYPQTNTVFGYSVPAYGLYVRHVRNLVVDNFRFLLRSPDARPAVVLDDCHGVRLSNFAVDVPSDNQPLIRVLNSTGVAVTGFYPVNPVPSLLRVEGGKSSGITISGSDLSAVRDVVTFGEGAPESAVRRGNNL